MSLVIVIFINNPARLVSYGGERQLIRNRLFHFPVFVNLRLCLRYAYCSLVMLINLMFVTKNEWRREIIKCEKSVVNKKFVRKVLISEIICNSILFSYGVQLIFYLFVWSLFVFLLLVRMFYYLSEIRPSKTDILSMLENVQFNFDICKL